MAADFDSVAAATSAQVAANTKAGPEAREAGVTLVSRKPCDQPRAPKLEGMGNLGH